MKTFILIAGAIAGSAVASTKQMLGGSDDYSEDGEVCLPHKVYITTTVYEDALAYATIFANTKSVDTKDWPAELPQAWATVGDAEPWAKPVYSAPSYDDKGSYGGDDKDSHGSKGASQPAWNYASPSQPAYGGGNAYGGNPSSKAGHGYNDGGYGAQRSHGPAADASGKPWAKDHEDKDKTGEKNNHFEPQDGYVYPSYDASSVAHYPTVADSSVYNVTRHATKTTVIPKSSKSASSYSSIISSYAHSNVSSSAHSSSVYSSTQSYYH